MVKNSALVAGVMIYVSYSFINAELGYLDGLAEVTKHLKKTRKVWFLLNH